MCSDSCMEIKTDRPTDQPTYQRTTNKRGHREVTFFVRESFLNYDNAHHLKLEATSTDYFVCPMYHSKLSERLSLLGA